MNGRRISGYENAPAPSALVAVTPAMTASHVSARVNSAREARLAISEVSTCLPSTDERGIDIDWSRSTIPPWRSVNSRYAV